MSSTPTAAREAADAAWPSGPLVRPAAWEEMVQAWPGRRVRRTSIRGGRSAVAELAAQGWVDSTGRFSDQAREALPNAANPAYTWHVTGRHQGVVSEVRAHGRQTDSTLSVGPDAATLRAASGDRARNQGPESSVSIRVLDSREIPTLLCAWAGVRPGASSTTPRLELPVPAFTARANGLASSPPPEFEHARELWNDDWFIWDVVAPSGAEHGFIGTLDHGNFAFGQVFSGDDTQIRLVPIGSGAIWRILEGAQQM
ncbi:hypothetical protein GCM10009596_05970 [Arthrobacter rhombi]|uniref:hypothetical protein n=1 Tax=Arthrobacter rhombi TaxID=71253 RepID=UPI0033792033